MKIFITGVSSGLGLYIANEFLTQGDEVRGIARRKLEDESLSGHDKFKYYQCDTTKSNEVKKTYDLLIEDQFIPDAIIFCAGSATDDIHESSFSADNFKENFNINLFAMTLWMELFLPDFQNRNRGVFAAISSMSSYLENHSHRIAYSASRIALNKAFENLQMEFLGSGFSFLILNMGRIQKESGLIGISYNKASLKIRKIIKSGKYPNKIDIPVLQALLTRLAKLMPKSVLKKLMSG